MLKLNNITLKFGGLTANKNVSSKSIGVRYSA